ncbi:glucokinase [uncultured Desulfovibrio sp.]|uniref:glucokinase n=1 Tax=uncultured Desulfovibrio sp. TaxID=167968 RepID=UPI0003A5F6FD|nr:glucokinase [uncultured Desulfovibrio sp.]
MQRIFAADIGGTNCRFASFSLDEGRLGLERVVWIKSAGLLDTDMVLAALERELETPLRAADALVLALAGPVRDGLRGKLTNGALRVDFTGLECRYGVARYRVINDFIAEAYGCLTEIGEHARCVASPAEHAEIPATASRGVLGAGTGLGTAFLVYNGRGGWLPVPAEGGHVSFPFVGDEENDFHNFVCGELGYPFARGDDILTGKGLSLLHRYLSGEDLDACEVAARALNRDTPTLRWYSRFYARACRNWILTTLCRRGLWIAGGIASRNPLSVTSGYFLEELYTTPHFAALVRSVPVYLIENKNSGLWGAAQAGMELLRREAH